MKITFHSFFLCAHSFPKSLRPQALTLVAWHHELHNIAAKVREPILGQMRFFWWRDGLDAIVKNNPSPPHPLLNTIAKLYFSGVLKPEFLHSIWDEAYTNFSEQQHASLALHNTLSELAAESSKAKRALRVREEWQRRNPTPRMCFSTTS